jgi:sorbitol-specific phosphotransferase system component IIA
VSPVVHGLPSSQAFVLFVNTHPVAGLHVSVVHTLASSQTTALLAKQAPPPQVSPAVQAFPSSQAIVLFVKTQPAVGSHVSVVHTLASSQTTAVPAWQIPPPQVSPVVQAFPSSQAFVLFV